MRLALVAVLLGLGSVLPVAPAAAQVPNDDIENRRRLRLEETITSSTMGCTVQRGCVDERLTGKCIEYHNDQWFEFTPPTSGCYYVNIGGQRCRDVRGVQLVVLTGTPCQPATYRVLSCVSLGTQDDVFVALDSLRAGQPYLLDVDGYLKDYCGFALQVSTMPRGEPVRYFPPSGPHTLPTASPRIELSWALPDSLLAAPPAAFRVLRREVRQYRSVEISRVPVLRDTYGRAAPAYALTDTLPGPGTYDYQVVTVPAGAGGPAPVRLRQWWYGYGEAVSTMPAGVSGGAAPAAGVLRLPLGRYPRRAQLSVVVTDPASGRVLLARQLMHQPSDPHQGEVAVGRWRAAGLKKVAVSITYRRGQGDFLTDKLLLSL